MTGPRVLLDLSNLVAGGGVQVGASFVDELVRISEDPAEHRRRPWLAGAAVEMSAQVADNLTRDPAALGAAVVDGRPLARARRRPDLPGRHPFDVAFTVFGPDFGPRRAPVRVVGFADVTSLFPEHAGFVGAQARLKHALRMRLSRRRFRTADLVVTEAAHVARSLAERWGIDPARTRVVPNVLNGIFRDAARHEPLGATLPDGPVLAFPTRAYPHKNLAVLGPAARLLRERHGLDVRFALTLTDAEWSGLDPATRDAAVNLGPVRVAQVPALYAACDGVVFPSLNECFSVTPLEALRAGRPLVASDREFVREIAGGAAWYAEPTDPASLADALAAMLTDAPGRARRVAEGERIAAAWPTAADRAEAYLAVVDEVLAGAR
ncbi:glycosyltransferase [Nocardioides solisilvae]|uniref:glycosyltransferase n=1 Tax=Nocardioides solisilvae TaxID=1542435 RepID=UPI000D744D02|nr:glycosyltransferase [Nocardioides solisilvae]